MTTGRPPRLVLLDARGSGLDSADLRRWARRASAGLAGHVSRSARYPLALVGWDDRPLGVDIERVGPCDQRFAELVCTPEERAMLAEVADRDHFLTSLWSSKEALAKLLGDPMRYRPGDLASPLTWPQDHVGAVRAAPVVVPEGYVGWVCWRVNGAEAPGPGSAVRPHLARLAPGQPAGVAAASTHRWPSQRTTAVQLAPSQ